jgi:hypothetical protein
VSRSNSNRNNELEQEDKRQEDKRKSLYSEDGVIHIPRVSVQQWEAIGEALVDSVSWLIGKIWPVNRATIEVIPINESALVLALETSKRARRALRALMEEVEKVQADIDDNSIDDDNAVDDTDSNDEQEAA